MNTPIPLENARTAEFARESRNTRGSLNARGTFVVIAAALLASACRKAPPQADHQSDAAAAASTSPAAAPDVAERTATVVRGTRWAGHIGTAAVEVWAKGQGSSFTGELVRFQFGRPILHEDLNINVDATGLIHLRGTKVKRTTQVASYGTEPNEYTVTLSADGTTLTEHAANATDAVPWTLAAGGVGQALSAPLDVSAFEHALESGTWAGWLYRGHDRTPLRMAITRKAATLVATLTNGALSWKSTVTIGRDGTFKVEPAARKTSRGEESNVFTADIREDLAVIEGEHSVTVTQGFISESDLEHIVLINQKVLPPPRATK